MPDRYGTIDGHPSIDGHRAHADPVTITVCAECGQMRTVLFLSRDRWYCSACRAAGDARPTVVPLGATTGRS